MQIISNFFLKQIFAFNADNAFPNDTQMTVLDKLPNSFEAMNHIHCFNHTLQLSVKNLLHPFMKQLDDNDKMPALVDISNDDEDALDFEGAEEPDEEEDKVEEDEIEDALEALSSEEKEELFKNTDDVRNVIQRVSFISW